MVTYMAVMVAVRYGKYPLILAISNERVVVSTTFDQLRSLRHATMNGN